ARLKTQSVRFMLLTFVGLGLAMLPVERAQAQQKVDAQLEQAATDYKSSLDRLLALYERDSKRAEDRLTTVRELFAQGLVTRRELEAAEDAAAGPRQKVAETQAQLKGADMAVAEALVEADAEESTRNLRSSSSSRAGNKLVRTTAYIRYGGAGAWSL